MSAFRSAIVFCTATAHLTAFRTLANSARMPCRVDDAAAVLADHRQDDRLVRLEVVDGRFLVRSHEGAVAGDVGGKDGG